MYKNIIYSLKLTRKTAPEKFIYLILYQLIIAIQPFIYSTVFLKVLLDFLRNEAPLLQILFFTFTLLGLFVILDGYKIFYKSYKKSQLDLKISKSIEQNFLQKTSQLDFSCFESKEFLDNMMRAALSGYEKIDSILQTIFAIIANIIALLAASIYLARIDIFLVTVLILPLICSFPMKSFSKNTYKWDVENTENNRWVNDIRETFLSGAKELFVSDIAEVLISYYQNNIKSLKRIASKYGIRQTALGLVITLLREVAPRFVALFYCIWRFTKRADLSISDFSVMITTVVNFTWRVNVLLGNIRSLHTLSLYIDNFQQFMNYKPKIEKTSVGIKPIYNVISFKNVCFSYPSDVKAFMQNALNNVSCTIKRGEKIAILGENGAGKTTFIKLLLRFYDPSEGKITVGDNELRFCDIEEYRKLFSVMFQNSIIFEDTVENNISSYEINESKLSKLCAALKFDISSDKLPDKLNTWLGRQFNDNGVILSGGEQNKLLILRALLADKEIYLLDEPTANLDPIAERNVFETIYQELRDKTVILVTHNILAASTAEKIIFMENGKIIESGSPDALMKKQGKYAQLYALQQKNQTERKNYENNPL